MRGRWLTGGFVGIFALGFLTGMIVFIAMMVWGLVEFHLSHPGFWFDMPIGFGKLVDYLEWYFLVGTFAGAAVFVLGLAIALAVLVARLFRRSQPRING